MAKDTRYTGTFKYKDKDKDQIDTVPKFQIASMKTFKGAKDASTEWLTKKNPVRQMTDPDYKGKGAK